MQMCHVKLKGSHQVTHDYLYYTRYCLCQQWTTSIQIELAQPASAQDCTMLTEQCHGLPSWFNVVWQPKSTLCSCSKKLPQKQGTW